MSPLVLFNLIGGKPDAGGAWTNPSQTSFNGILNPQNDSSGIYTYKLQGQAPCLSKTAVLNITINTLYSAGQDAALVICDGDPPFNFFNILNGDPDIYGIWTDPNNQLFNGLSSSLNLINGKYRYKISNSLPCPEDSAFVDLTIKTPPVAGEGKLKQLCETDLPIELMLEISGNPDSNGLWYGPKGNLFSGFFDPSIQSSGTYVYVVLGEVPCASDSAKLEIQVLPLPSAGPDQQFNICWNTDVNLTSLLDTASDVGGIWLLPDRSSMNGNFSAKKNGPGKYYYVMPANAQCPPDTALAEISIIDAFDIYAGPDVFLVIGSSKPLKASSYNALHFSWEPSEGLSNSEISNPKVFTEVTTLYVVTGYDQYGCENKDTINVVVLPRIFIPNSFTPNGDGINDYWFIESLAEYPASTVYVFTENNMEVFKSSGIHDRWDGTHNGHLVPQGNYYYIIEFKDEAMFGTLAGKLTILR
jgi:gliding motility-associated-like protein